MESNSSDLVPQAPISPATQSAQDPNQQTFNQSFPQNQKKPEDGNSPNLQGKVLSNPGESNNLNHSNLKTNKLSVISITMIFLWLGTMAFLYLAFPIFEAFYRIILTPLTYLFGDSLPLFVELGPIFIIAGLMIVCPPLAFLSGLISLTQSNNTNKGKTFSKMGMALGALFSLPALFFLLLAVYYANGGTGPF